MVHKLTTVEISWNSDYKMPALWNNLKNIIMISFAGELSEPGSTNDEKCE